MLRLILFAHQDDGDVRVIFLVHGHERREDTSEEGEAVLEGEDADGDEVGVEAKVYPQF